MKKTICRGLAALVASSGALVAGVGIAPDSAQASVATVTETATADGHVSSAHPLRVYPAARRMHVGAGRTTYKTYLRFDLTDRRGTLTGASLQLHTKGTGSGSAATQSVSVTSNRWSESRLRYDHAPAVGRTVGTLRAPRADRTYTIPLRVSALQSAVGRRLSLVITQRTPDGVALASRVTSTPPRLSLTFAKQARTSTPTAGRREAAVRRGWGAPIAGDEFNYAGAPNSSKWSVYDSAGHSGNGRRSPSHVTVNGSALRITGDAHGNTGGLSQRFHRTYGKWEARMRVSPGRDSAYHPVLILWPDQGRVAANNCAEMDYAESTKTVNKVNFFLHHSCSGGQAYASRTLDMTQWHNYAIEWRAGVLRGYIDGVQYFESTSASQIPDDPAHQTIQLDWFPDGTSTTQSWMEVDWLRVYR